MTHTSEVFMVRIKFHLGLKFWLNGREYEIEKRLSNGDFQVIDVAKGVLSTYSESSLCKLFFENKLKFNTDNTSNKTKKNYLSADFSQLESDLKLEAKRRFKYIQCFLESGQQKRTESSLQPIINKISQELADNKPPHWSTLYRWIKKYESSEGDIRFLVPNDIAKGRKSQLHPEVLSIIQQAIDEYYLTLQKPLVSNLYSQVIFEITKENIVRQKIGLSLLEIPCQLTIYRIVNKLDPYEEMVARYGKAAADKMFNTCKYSPPNTMRPLEIVEIDHTKLPLYVVDLETNLPIGIPTLTTAIDRYTGMPIGYYISFEPASYLSVMHCLWHSIQPKDYVQRKFPSVKHTWPCYGLMSALKTDNAPEFKGVQLEDACNLLFIDLDYAPPRLPWYKAKVERFFRTISTTTLQGQPGSFLKFMNKYDDEYDPKKSAVISLDSLQEILHLFIIDIVGQMPHPKFGIPRVDVWLQGTSKYPPVLPSSLQDLRVLLGAVTYRVISQNGIEFEGLYYRSPELTRLRNVYEQRDKRRSTGRKEREKAKIKYDPANISFIYVFDPDSHNFVAVPAVDQNYTSNLSLWQHKVIKKLAYLSAQQVDIIALSIAKQKIQDIVKRDWSTTNRGRTKTSMARWLGIGRDGLDTSDVEAWNEEQIAISNQNIQSSTSKLDESDSRIGISDFIGAFDYLDDSQMPALDNLNSKEVNQQQSTNHQLETNHNLNTNALSSTNELITPPTENEISEKTPSRQKKGVKNKEAPSQKAQKKKSPADINIEIEKDDWQPDLSEWSVSYVEPKSCN
jgi:putative transposase